MTKPVWSAIALTLCLLGAIVATWPLTLHLRSAIPLGTEQEATVPLFNIWTLWWTADRIGHGFSSYWDAPIFYPNPGAFTYSEPQPLTGLVVWPLWVSGLPPALIYNVALLLILTLNGWGAFRLLRVLSLPCVAATLGGLLVVALPFSAKVLGVLPILPIFGTLWTLESLIRFSDTRHRRYAIGTSAGYVVQCLTSQQLALLSAPFLGSAGLLALWLVRQDRRAVISLLLAVLSSVVLIALLAAPILSLHRSLGFERPFGLVQALSAEPSDFLTRPGTAVWSVPPREPRERDTGGLFPGLFVLFLAGGGIASALHHHEFRRWYVLFGIMVVGSFMLALGLHVNIGGWYPFASLRSLLPGFGQLRSPYRFAVFTQLGLCLMAAMTLVRLAQWRPGFIGHLFALALGILAAVENLSIPVPLVEIPTTPRTQWTSWLKTQPSPTIVAHIPFSSGLHVSHYEIEAWRQFAQIDHGKPLVNGYSGFFPPGYSQFQLDATRSFPSQALLCIMAQNLRVTTLIIDRDWLATHTEQVGLFSNALSPLYEDASVAIFRLVSSQLACATEADRLMSNPEGDR